MTPRSGLLPHPRNEKLRAVSLLVLAQFAVMSLWFTATASVPQLTTQYRLGPVHAAAMTSAVQIGFVIGTLASAVLSLADRWDSRRFFAVSAMVGAAANLAMTQVDPAGLGFLLLRMLVGISMAGVYPVGMKMVASWSSGRDLGLLMSLVVGALTVGAAFPSLSRSVGGEDWRLVMFVATAMAFVGALLGGSVKPGGELPVRPRFSFKDVSITWKHPELRLVGIGYLGHMWELYAMWAWIGLFLHMSFAARGLSPASADILAAATIASGALGCIGAGFLADRVGRPAIAINAMTISGLCAAAIGFAFDGPLWLVVIISLVWGVTVIADSAQFSAVTAELSDPPFMGTILTAQICCGFMLTVVSLQIIPVLADMLTWKYAFMILAPGPFCGIMAMSLLRRRRAGTGGSLESDDSR